MLGGQQGSVQVQVTGHVTGLHQRLRCQQHQPLDHVAQLAHIAWPRVLLQQRVRLGREVHVALVGLVGTVQKMQRQRVHVFTPLAQAGQAYGHHVEPVEQILPEAASLHLAGQVTVGGGHQPHINAHLARAAQAHQRALLQRAQQLGLHGQRQLAHFVQKNGAAVRLLEPACTRLACTGERPALMTEEFRLEQRVGNGRAVHFDERPVAPPAGQVQRACKQLFARARFTQQQHRGLRCRYLFQLAQGAQQRSRSTDEAVACCMGVQRMRQGGVAVFQLPRLLRYQLLQLQHLTSQRGQYAQQGHVIGQVPLSAADAVAGQHTHGGPVDGNGQRQEGHGFYRQLPALDRPKQKQGFGIHVLNNGG